MILGDTKIKRYVTGAEDWQIGPASVDVRLGDTWATPFANCRVKLGEKVQYVVEKTEKKKIKPHEFILATTQERIKLPVNVAAFVQGRSSIGRIGLTVQNAGYVDPGFHGHITLELVNESESEIELNEGYPVAQLVFFECDGVSKPYTGKYNGQKDATGSMMDRDREQYGFRL